MKPLVLIAALALAEAAGAQPLDGPLRAIHNGGNWAFNQDAADRWEADPSQPLLPASYVDWLDSTNIDWVGISVALHVDDSVDSTVEREYSGVRTTTFTDAALRQLIREYRQHGVDVYLTLAFEIHEAEGAARPLARHLLGDPGDPRAGKPLGHEVSDRIDPADWPWRPNHPDHDRFVTEFWRTYTEQAVHIARIAQEEGGRMFGLGTETDGLFRSRAGGYWRNHFLPELRGLVSAVRAVYSGLLTYDQHYSAVEHEHYAPGSRHLWQDLGLDAVGVSAWFPLADRPPTSVLSVEYFRQQYDRIFREHLIPTAARSELPVVLLEYGIVDMVDRPYQPDMTEEDSVGAPYSDRNGNGLDDGQEQQTNVIEGLLRTVAAYPGAVYGAFFWNNWIVSEERWAQHLEDVVRGFSFRGKLAEDAVRAAYDRFQEVRWLPARTLQAGAGDYVVPVGSPVAATSSAPDVAAVAVSGSRVTVRPLSEGVASITVTGDGRTLQFTVRVLDFGPERAALEALYRSTGGGSWAVNTNWLTAAPFEDWHGVEVGQSGHITALRLGAWDEAAGRTIGNGLVGTLPPELRDLVHLQYLALAGNELTGPIPPALGRLTELRDLQLQISGLTGSIPAALGRLTNLQGLDFGANPLTGPILRSLTRLTNLEWFNLDATRVCVPDDPAVRAWLATIDEFLSSGLTCAGTPTGSFTDHPIEPGVTPVRAVHFTELQDRINALRAAFGLQPMAWSDLRPGVPVRLAHVLELRRALEAVYTAVGRPTPTWNGLVAGVRVNPDPRGPHHGAPRRGTVVGVNNRRAEPHGRREMRPFEIGDVPDNGLARTR